jgi:hypothetical protein
VSPISLPVFAINNFQCTRIPGALARDRIVPQNLYT